MAVQLAGKKSIVMFFGLTAPNDTISIKPFEIFKKEIEIKKTNIKNLYLQKVNNQITIEIFTQKRNEINEQIKEREKRISQISEYIDEEIQKQEIREQFKKFKNENNLMKYIHDLVKSINFYKDGKIEIMLSFGK